MYSIIRERRGEKIPTEKDVRRIASKYHRKGGYKGRLWSMSKGSKPKTITHLGIWKKSYVITYRNPRSGIKHKWTATLISARFGGKGWDVKKMKPRPRR